MFRCTSLPFRLLELQVAPVFHGDNTGSNPVGDAKSNQQFARNFAGYSKVQKATSVCPKCTLETESSLCGSYDHAVFKRASHREEEGQDRGLGSVLGRRNGLCVDIHRRPEVGMPHQFLHHFELCSDAPEQSGISVEGMPADAFLNIQ